MDLLNVFHVELLETHKMLVVLCVLLRKSSSRRTRLEKSQEGLKILSSKTSTVGPENCMAHYFLSLPCRSAQFRNSQTTIIHTAAAASCNGWWRIEILTFFLPSLILLILSILEDDSHSSTGESIKNEIVERKLILIVHGGEINWQRLEKTFFSSSSSFLATQQHSMFT